MVSKTAQGSSSSNNSLESWTGERARQEYAKPFSTSRSDEVRALAESGLFFYPGKDYCMDASKSQIAQQYVSGKAFEGTVSREISYDKDTHAASQSGYKMFPAGVGFIHTNGAVSRAEPGGGVVCSCGCFHVC